MSRLLLALALCLTLCGCTSCGRNVRLNPPDIQFGSDDSPPSGWESQLKYLREQGHGIDNPNAVRRYPK